MVLKLSKIFKILNRFIWDIVWYGFWCLLIVVLVSKPPLFYDDFQYTPEYSNKLNFEGFTNHTNKGVIATTRDDERVVFIETISKRVEVLRYVLVLYFLLMILLYYEPKILGDLDKETQNKYKNLKAKLRAFQKRINW